MAEISVRAATIGDLPVVRLLNDAAVPHVNLVSEEFLRARLNDAQYFRLCMDSSGMPCGFLLALGPGLDYDSPNYQWFCRRYESFLYVDRVVVVSSVRGKGLGSRLYRDVIEYGSPWVRFIVCEVNLRPPNPGSLAFHARLGFREVGRQMTEGGAKEVALLAKVPAPDSAGRLSLS